MYFLNYKETNLRYVYSSSLRLLFIRQNNIIKNSNMIKLPKVELYFIFNKVQEVNLLKLSNHVMLMWLITGQKSWINKIFNRLERGVRYQRFVIMNKIYNVNLGLFFVDFLVNTFFYLVEKNNLQKYENLNEYFFKVKSLELFSNIRLSNNYYTSKVNDNLMIKFFLGKHNVLKIDYFLQNLKLKWVK